jgi:hypothetical protein
MDIDLNNLKYLFFVGSGRTGSTLLGQIINKHPECLISNENRFLQEIIENKKNYIDSIKNMINNAYYQFANGLGKNEQYQKDWKDINYFKKSKIIKVVGDKKQGGNVSIYNNHKEKFLDLIHKLGEKNTYFIQITRNPIDSIASYQISHNYSLEESKNRVLSDTISGYEIISKFKNGKLIYYEDLLNNTEDVLTSLCDYLNLTWCDEWLSSVTNVISLNKKINYLNDNVKDVKKIYDCHNIFKRYRR